MVEHVILTLNFIVYGCFVAAIVALPFFVVNMVRSVNSMPRLASPGLRASRTPIKSILFFVTPIATAMVLAEIIAIHARSDTLRILGGLSSTPTLVIDGHDVKSPERILSALKEMQVRLGHHSHPTTRIAIVVRTNDEDLSLILGRDSENPIEYWIYYPKYGVTSDNEIGRIFTDALQSY
jgi:hypothetical protein